MYRKCIGVALSTLGLLLMACDGTVVSPEVSEGPAFDRSGFDDDDIVRIKGDIAFTTDEDQPFIPCGGGIEAGVVTGSGEATHLGTTAFTFSTVSCAVDFGAATLTANGPFTFTGANGDGFSGTSDVIFDLSGVLSGTSQFGGPPRARHRAGARARRPGCFALCPCPCGPSVRTRAGRVSP